MGPRHATSAVISPPPIGLRARWPIGAPLVVAALLLAAPVAGLAQTPEELGQLSIEELMNIAVTAASRKDELASDVAAAIFVVTHDEIRRSGMTTIPDLLRLVPGVNVAQINSNRWAVTVRGFNGLYANKLLVLVDGRTVYNQLFSGVFWDALDLMVDDIDRIEVVRGPAAALWGANAVNGVINIVSKTAARTQGGLVRGDVGIGQQGAMRYGGMIGATPYRVHAQWTDRNESLLAGERAGDASRSLTTGFRTDWASPSNAIMLEGGFTAGRTHALFRNLDPLTSDRVPITADHGTVQGANLVGRWTFTRPGGASLQVQSFVDWASRQEPGGDYGRHAFDIDTQYRTVLGTRHDVVTGAGYRAVGEQLDGAPGITLTPVDEHLWRVTGFVHDDIALNDRLSVTIGSQVQYGSDSGVDMQPTARVLWKPRPRQRLWAAVSRAVRTPSLADRGLRVDYPPVPDASGLPLYVSVRGNPQQKTETFIDAEAGYRIEIGSAASIDVAGFVGRYDDLWSTEVDPPVVELAPSPRFLVTSRFDNLLRATTRGLEVSAFWAPVAAWHLDGSYSAFHLTPRHASASAAIEDGSVPRQQWQLRAAYQPGSRATLNLAIFHVGPITQLRIEGYTRTDASAEWRFSSRLSLMAIGQNLLDQAHPEFDGATGVVQATEARRSAGLRLRWTFP